MIIRKIEDLDKVFKGQNKTINIFLQPSSNVDIINNLFSQNNQNKDKIFVYLNKNGKLVTLEFPINYEINSYIQLDKLSRAKKIDYSIDF